jgi:hypothetical protein
MTRLAAQPGPLAANAQGSLRLDQLQIEINGEVISKLELGTQR